MDRILNKLSPGSVVGIIGGGQLGRMLSMAAARLGMDVLIYSPQADSPAERVSAGAVIGAYSDHAALKAFASRCDVVTFEFENIPADAVASIEASGTPTFPNAKALKTAQDRLHEKVFLNTIGVVPAAFEKIGGPEDIKPALEKLGGKGILKARRDGYDGKGQARLDLSSDPMQAWFEIGQGPAVLEAFVSFEREISVLVARGQDGAIAIYDTPENDHSGGILKSSTLPAKISDETRDKAKAYGQKLAEELNYVGLLALELFVLADGRLFANEFAPRVHNSGHWTEEACLVSQFEQHIRAVCGWPLGPTTRFVDIRMSNLLGDNDIAQWEALAENGEAPRIYGKRGGGEGRKLGHSNKIL